MTEDSPGSRSDSDDYPGFGKLLDSHPERCAGNAGFSLQARSLADLLSPRLFQLLEHIRHSPIPNPSRKSAGWINTPSHATALLLTCGMQMANPTANLNHHQ